MKPLAGKRALVTGAASGIGLATALALQDAGAAVVGLDLQASNAAFPILACDLGEEAHIVAAVAKGADLLGGYDILVNNAGILQEVPLGSLTTGHIDRMFAVNVRG
ncbi:MAG: SDR family NAD(P)-dependent oxidoreductase, partial [Candidatus Saccharibacteria bacterium]|nr:SDR family NAD(P)-dependent oxidoreductase [Pseudorhodobacter sp.]